MIMKRFLVFKVANPAHHEAIKPIRVIRERLVKCGDSVRGEIITSSLHIRTGNLCVQERIAREI